MKTKLPATLLTTCLIVAVSFAFSFAQERGSEEARVSPNASVSQTVGTAEISITYGRPSVNDREIFGGLVPFDETWRTGANETTVIVFPVDVTVEGESLPAGTYSIYTVPGESQWTIIFNSKLSWGTQYDETQDVLRVQTEPMEASSREQFMIYFENVTDQSADVVLHWAETKVPFTVEV